MPKFEVEVIHEPSGVYMNFEVDYEEFDPEFPITEDNAWEHVMDELSIIVNQVEE